MSETFPKNTNSNEEYGTEILNKFNKMYELRLERIEQDIGYDNIEVKLFEINKIFS